MVETATLAGGCFWCTEAIFQKLPGVISVMPGYAGGTVTNPTYEQVCMGTTGHAESIQIKFDPQKITYDHILDVFWHTHDPTTQNQQGSDFGPQYRSVVFYHSPLQQHIAEDSKSTIQKAGIYPGLLVTEILPYTNFFPAEDYHQNYFARHPDAPYCRLVIVPKLKKLTQLESSTGAP
jgi:peptide-methionine (S)-S-oxide reductase